MLQHEHFLYPATIRYASVLTHTDKKRICRLLYSPQHPTSPHILHTFWPISHIPTTVLKRWLNDR